MPLQFASQANTIKDKIIVKKEKYSKDNDETDAYLKLEDQVREQIKKH